MQIQAKLIDTKHFVSRGKMCKFNRNLSPFSKSFTTDLKRSVCLVQIWAKSTMEFHQFMLLHHKRAAILCRTWVPSDAHRNRLPGDSWESAQLLVGLAWFIIVIKPLRCGQVAWTGVGKRRARLMHYVGLMAIVLAMRLRVMERLRGWCAVVFGRTAAHSRWVVELVDFATLVRDKTWWHALICVIRAYGGFVSDCRTGVGDLLRAKSWQDVRIPV